MLPDQFKDKLHDVPSEKTVETLFVSNAFHYLRVMYPRLRISIFAPSQTDEDALGYDARFVGANFAFEVLLQFKKSILESDVFTIKPSHAPSDDHGRSQHEVLQSYPNRTAFYVAPTFKTYDSLGKKQTIDSEEFLDNYVAVDVSRLSRETSRIRYEANRRGFPTQVRHLEKNKRDKDAELLNYPLAWLKGSELFKFFIAGIVIKSSSGSLKLQDANWDQSVGALVRFNDVFNRGVSMYSSITLAEVDYRRLIDDPDYQYGELINRRLQRSRSDLDDNVLRIGTSGIYIFRVYNPFLR